MVSAQSATLLLLQPFSSAYYYRSNFHYFLRRPLGDVFSPGLKTESRFQVQCETYSPARETAALKAGV